MLHNHGNFDVFEKYGVDEYLSSFGMYVPQKYAGRKIGEKLLEARSVYKFWRNFNLLTSIFSSKYLARPCEIKLRHAFFTSDISNKIADNLGYTTDVELR